MAPIPFATHEKGAMISIGDSLDLEIDPSLFKHHIENLENKRSLVISEDDIFGIFGIGETFYQSQVALRWNLISVLRKQLTGKTLIAYLQDKGFELSTWAQVANLNPKLMVTQKDRI